MEQSFRDEYDTDISLEYDQETAEADFREFYLDTLPEFEKIGRVVVMKVKKMLRQDGDKFFFMSPPFLGDGERGKGTVEIHQYIF